MRIILKGYKIYKMKPCNITIVSNNFNSLNDFFLFFFFSKKGNLNVIKKYFQKKKRKKVLTILKSPHVNKTAQEQFEYRNYSRQLTLYSSQNFQYLVFLKKIKTHLFPDINLKTEFKIGQGITKKREVLNPNNFNINLFKEKNFSDSKIKAKNFIKSLDVYGEFTLMNSGMFG